MREEAVPVKSWVRRELSTQFGAVMQEALPQDMLDLLMRYEGQD